MAIFLRACLLYLLVSLVMTMWLNNDPIAAIKGIMAAAAILLDHLGGIFLRIWPVFPVALFILGPKRCIARLIPLVQVCLAVLAIQTGFLFMKSAIPQLAPFWADPLFARLDQVLLFGNDAWSVAHNLTPDAITPYFPMIYMPVWFVTAAALPIVIVATDPDPARFNRHAWLFLGAWVVIGNIAATLGSSVGPVFYDQLLGTDRFADLKAALAASGVTDGPIGHVQARLWANQDEVDGIKASGISAFPSVHVAIATITALYLAERFRAIGAAAGAVFLGLILLISVYSGYHYLIDGIVSIVLIWAMDRAIRRWQARAAVAPRPSAIEPSGPVAA